MMEEQRNREQEEITNINENRTENKQEENKTRKRNAETTRGNIKNKKS